jgi:hypothetical protein
MIDCRNNSLFLYLERKDQNYSLSFLIVLILSIITMKVAPFGSQVKLDPVQQDKYDQHTNTE